MAKQRSPNCPQISFAEAIEKGRKVYDKEHTHPAAKTVVAGDLGYSGLNGRSLTLIGALRQYGILEGSGDALRVTKDAIAYFELDEGPEKTAAMRRMALGPDLFAELSQLHIHSLPSDGNLRHELVNRGFTSKAADDVIKVYKANVALAKGEEEEYDGAEALNVVEAAPVSTASVAPAPVRPAPLPAVSSDTYAYPLAPGVRAELVLRGPIEPAHLERLRSAIDLTIEALGGQPRKTEQPK